MGVPPGAGSRLRRCRPGRRLRQRRLRPPSSHQGPAGLVGPCTEQFGQRFTRRLGELSIRRGPETQRAAVEGKPILPGRPRGNHAHERAGASLAVYTVGCSKDPSPNRCGTAPSTAGHQLRAPPTFIGEALGSRRLWCAAAITGRHTADKRWRRHEHTLPIFVCPGAVILSTSRSWYVPSVSTVRRLTSPSPKASVPLESPATAPRRLSKVRTGKSE